MSSNIKVCKKCNSNEIEVDRARGITYCTSCGNVLEESIIVSEVQIEEGSGGGMSVVGQFVGANDTRGISIHGMQNSLRESKEITLANGKRLINEMASQLRLNQHCVDTAFNFYKLAVQRGLTRGRKIRQVIAACLYLVCRTEGTPHMLLDLCDIVQDDACYISSLGKLAMKFAYLLCIKLPEIDPGLFIPRFAQKLDFGERTHDVTFTALRLVQRMNRDWMATGRRPSGLCGAALLVAARMYNFERNLDDIVKVVKIGKTTLRKRILEFEDTPSSALTVDEFHEIDLEEEQDPPAFTRSRKFAKIKQIEEMTNIQEIEREIMQLQENIELALSELQQSRRGPLAKYAKINEFETSILGPNKDVTNIDAEIKEAEEFLSEEQISIIKSIVVETATTTTTATSATSSSSTSSNATAASTSAAAAAEANSELESSSGDADDARWQHLRPTLRSLGLVRERPTPPLPVATHSATQSAATSDNDDDDDDSDDDESDDDEGEDDLDESMVVNDDDGGDDDNDDHDDDIDLECIRKRRRAFKRRRRLLKRRKLAAAAAAAVAAVPVAVETVDESAPVVADKETPATTAAAAASVADASASSEQDKSNDKNDSSSTSAAAATTTGAAVEATPLASTSSTSIAATSGDVNSNADEDLDLTGIDDGEIDSMILSKDEIKTKAKLWLRANKDWLKEQKTKEDQKKKDKEESNHVEVKQNKTRVRKPKNTTPVANPQEAIERMLQEKKLSSKINYDVLKNLNKDFLRK